MKIPVAIALLSQKGGAGKTTIAMQLAAALSAAGRRVAVADLDPQESALRWAEAASGGPPRAERVFAVAGAAGEIASAVDRGAAGCDLVLLDCPPSIEHPHTLGALERVELAIVPIVPGPTDLWSTRAVERLILLVQQRRPVLRAALLPNRVQHTTLAGDVLEVMREFTLPVMPVALAQRNAYAQSAVQGGSVFHLGRAAQAARDEMTRLAAAVLKLTGAKKE
ncbi:AAA family ATPase [Pseudothauera rhizosphaerae]|uniref:Chromosome partitioning protein ParA n=1 Tax=Pseudothauera rhizosphaerae TaxID=2565932 RepID=A0A4V3WA67_9RHOO|nr:AAA family ATPase [Pseudothauera rhizosphaerae]THF58070.1 chromosome partitioning protein ParA [Pseudothauera rhizosphaerae]